MASTEEDEGRQTVSRRLSIADDTGVSFATITLTAAETGALDIGVAGSDRAEEIASWLEGVKARRLEAGTPGTPDDALEQELRLLQEIAVERGCVATVLPRGDIQIDAVFDLRTGRSVAAQTALNPSEPDGPDLTQTLNAVLQNMPAHFSRIVVEEVEAGLRDEDHVAAARALETAQKDGRLGFADASVLNVAYRISPEGLDESLQVKLRELRVALAAHLGRHDLVEADLVALLARSDLEPEMRANLELERGIVLKDCGAVQAAIGIWRKVANDTTLAAGSRAWAWRNLSLALPPIGMEAVHAARASADAFLEAGDQREAVASLLGQYDILQHHDPARAIEELQGLLGLVAGSGLTHRLEQGALHHALGDRFLHLRQGAPALSHARAAIALRRDLAGAEEELISSLHLAAQASKVLGQSEDAAAFEIESEALTQSSGSRHFQLGGRVAQLFEAYDSAVASELIAETRTNEDPNLWVSAEVAAAMCDPSLKPVDRLAKLELLQAELGPAHARRGVRKVVALAIATELARQDDLPASGAVLQAALAEDPGALDVRDRLVATLRLDGRWGDLAILLRRQIALHGEAAGLQTALGQALLESGDASGAVTALTAARKLMGPDHPAWQVAGDLRDRALDVGGTLQPPRAPSPETPLSSEDLGRALRDYAVFISSEKRMSLWRSGPSHVWVDQPERQAQDLLHTFLKARFDAGIEVFEELGAGAGRMDLLVRLRGGLQAVVELKLCGYGYSSAYAASGEDQIRHYLKARRVHLGYLVVHDARLRDNGHALLPPTPGPDTVVEVLIDVCPRMPEKRRAKDAPRPGGDDDPAG